MEGDVRWVVRVVVVIVVRVVVVVVVVRYAQFLMRFCDPCAASSMSFNVLATPEQDASLCILTIEPMPARTHVHVGRC